MELISQIKDTSLKNKVQKLYELISDMCDMFWCAGWIDGIETDVWKYINDIEDMPTYNGTMRNGDPISDGLENLSEIKKISSEIDGWVDYEYFYNLREWKQRFEDGQKKPKTGMSIVSHEDGNIDDFPKINLPKKMSKHYKKFNRDFPNSKMSLVNIHFVNELGKIVKIFENTSFFSLYFNHVPQLNELLDFDLSKIGYNCFQPFISESDFKKIETFINKFKYSTFKVMEVVYDHDGHNISIYVKNKKSKYHANNDVTHLIENKDESSKESINQNRVFKERYFTEKEKNTILRKIDKNYDPEIEKIDSLIRKIEGNKQFISSEEIYLLKLLKSDKRRAESTKERILNIWRDRFFRSEGKLLFDRWYEFIALLELSTKELNLLRIYKDIYNVKFVSELEKDKFLSLNSAGKISWENISKTLEKIEYHEGGCIKKI